MVSKKEVAYTVFQGRAGDHNNLAISGAKSIGDAFARRVGAAPVIIGTPTPAMKVGWREELDAAMPDLQAVQARFEEVFSADRVSVAAISRCVVSLATLPVMAKYHPDICVVWFDAHGDLNTPEASTTGFLGGLALAAPLGLWESGLGSGLNLDQIVLVGQRDLDPFESALIKQHSIPHIHPGPDLAQRLREAIAGRAVYVHLDCDVLEPGIVPTDYAHAGGLTLADLSACCETIAAHSFTGIEVAEFQNAWEPDGAPVSPEPLIEALMPLIRAFGCP